MSIRLKAHSGSVARLLAAALLAAACTSTTPESAEEVPQISTPQDADSALPTKGELQPSPQTPAPPQSANTPSPLAPPEKLKSESAKTTRPVPAAKKKEMKEQKQPATAPLPVVPAPPPSSPPEPTKTACGADLPPKDFGRQDVYRNRPFQPGESANYEVSYMGVHAGYGNIDVEQPIKHEGTWHQVFSGNASTGDWYEKIFIVKDKIRAVSRPWDFGAAQFYIEQDEGTFFGRRFTQKKWINFDHNNCKVYERTENRKKEIKNDEFALEPGADDALSAFFALRTLKFTAGKTERVLVYTSEKNWFLDAEALGEDTVEVPSGTFKAMKLKLTTYLGKDLQQKGDVYIWIATDHPNRPMVRVEAEVKVGKIQIKLKKFAPGRS